MAENVLVEMAKDAAKDILERLNVRKEDLSEVYEMMVAVSLAYLEAAFAEGREEHDGTCWLKAKFIRGGCNKDN
jgi:hypothetical protein